MSEMKMWVGLILSEASSRGSKVDALSLILMWSSF